MLSGEQIAWIIEHLTGEVSLSFAGLPEIHDRHRLTISGQGLIQPALPQIGNDDWLKAPGRLGLWLPTVRLPRP